MNLSENRSKLEDIFARMDVIFQISFTSYMQNKNERKELEKQLTTLQQDVGKLHSVEAKLKEEKTRLENLVSIQGKEFNKEDKVTVDKTIDYYERNITYFKKYMGLTIKRSAEDKLFFAMANIHPKKPNKNFWFEIKIEENVFRFCDSEPAINHISLMEELNRTQNAMAFVCSIREAFKESCI